MDFVTPPVLEAAAPWIGLALVVAVSFVAGFVAHKRLDERNTIECFCEDDHCLHCHPSSETARLA